MLYQKQRGKLASDIQKDWQSSMNASSTQIQMQRNLLKLRVLFVLLSAKHQQLFSTAIGFLSVLPALVAAVFLLY